MLPSRALRHRHVVHRDLGSRTSRSRANVYLESKHPLLADPPRATAKVLYGRASSVGGSSTPLRRWRATGPGTKGVAFSSLSTASGPHLRDCLYGILVEIRYKSELGRAVLNVFFSLLLASISFGAVAQQTSQKIA